MRGYRETARLKDYDYSQAGGYFLTICTYKRRNSLGEVLNQEMKLSHEGEIVKMRWLNLRDKFANIDLDYYVIMPNHVHGIITILEEVGAIHELPLQRNRLQRRRMLLPRIIGYFKMNSAKEINRLRDVPTTSLWQRNYYEHVVRNESELHKIREYIQNNPLKWELDRENPLSKNFNSPDDLYWKEIYDPARTIHELSLQTKNYR
jgi:putative transposase